MLAEVATKRGVVAIRFVLACAVSADGTERGV
jgi:hypothetical protein